MRPTSILALVLLASFLAGPALGAPDGDPRPTVPAEEILAKIERGEPVEYDGVIVVGDLDLSEVDLPTKHVERTEDEIEDMGLTEEVKVVESPVIITDSEIRGDVRFDNAIFQNIVSFEETNFTEYYVLFPGTNFRGEDKRGTSADFRKAVFSGGRANFGGAVFSGGDADFEEAIFRGGRADFERAVFSFNDADFGGTVFSGGDADFRGAVFIFSHVDFSGAVFSGGDADFIGAHFNGGDADFRRAVFDGDAEFSMAKFNRCESYFWWAEFSDNAYFEGAVFIGGNSDFRKAEFSERVTFEKSIFYHTNLMLDGSKIYILTLSNANFENGTTISLAGTNYQRLYVHWDSIKNALVYNGEVYLTLVKNFRNIEYFEDADGCYYQYRRERQAIRSWGERAKYTDILAWLTCGYGVRPGYTLGLGVFVVLVSAIYYRKTNAIRRLKGDENKSANIWDALYFSIMTFTTIGYGDWYPLDRHRKVVMIEGIVGWLTLSLFLVTLANVVIR